MKKRAIISILQIIIAIIQLFLFFYTIPWIFSEKIENLEIKKDFPPPGGVVAFTIDHGKPSYFLDSPTTNPIKAIMLVLGLFLCLTFLIISAFLSTQNLKNKLKE